jgi:hypothetical protein
MPHAIDRMALSALTHFDPETAHSRLIALENIAWLVPAPGQRPFSNDGLGIEFFQRNRPLQASTRTPALSMRC